MKLLPQSWTAGGWLVGHTTGPGPGPPIDGGATWIVANYDARTGGCTSGWTYENPETQLAAGWPIYDEHITQPSNLPVRGHLSRSWISEALVTINTTIARHLLFQSPITKDNEKDDDSNEL